jgi:O-antigen ligase
VAATFPLAIAVLIDRNNNKWLRIIAVGALLGGVYAEFAAASRGGTVGLLVAVAVSGVLMTVPGRTRFTNLAVIGGFVAALVVFGPRSFQERVVASAGPQAPTAMGGRRIDVTSERAEHLQVALRMIPEHPWMGWGKEGFPEIRARHSGRRTPPHSVALAISVAYGIPAAIIYFGIIATAFVTGIRAVRRWRRGRNYGYAVVAALAAAVMSGLTTPEYFRLPTWHLVSLLFILNQRTPQIVAADEADARDEDTPEPAPAAVVLPLRARPALPLRQT